MEDKQFSLEEYQGALILGQDEYNEAMSWADGFWERRQKEKDAARKAARLQRLQRLADNLAEEEAAAFSKVADAEPVMEGFSDNGEICDKVEELEISLKRIQKTANDIEETVDIEDEDLYRRSRRTLQKAEEKIRSTVRKLRRRLPSPEGSDAGSYVLSGGGRRDGHGGQGGQGTSNDAFVSALAATTEAFTGALKLTTSKPGSQTWPTFDGSYKEF